jgi:hypothetical protein
MPGRRPRHIRKSARNDAQCGDLKKRPSPQRDLAKSLFLSSMHSCEIANCEMGTNMARTLRNIRLKGASSPLLKHHDRQTAEHSQRNRWAQLAVSTGTRRPRAPSLALPSMFARWLALPSMFARWRPGDLHLRRNVLSRPLSRPFRPFLLLQYLTVF